ncbi:MAG: M48 family metallopeptidase, partial [Kiritimatiellae bacterium]|nr:M48 family metallopeptidase [Kiritimatiellia bacterium]
MPSFLDYQDKARKRTRFLVALYLAFLCGIVALFCLLAGGTAALAENLPPEAALADPDWLLDHSGVFAWTAGIVLAVVGIATLFKASQLGGGGEKVAEALGGRRVSPRTRDRLEKRFLNVVEEMSIASGIAIPAAYVLDGEQGINAFAAGTSANRAAVAVTRGALENLSRDELQCVVGHEFSHILNGDMRLNVRLLASIFGIVCLAVFGKVLMRAAWEVMRSPRVRRSKDDKDDRLAIAMALALAGLAVWVLGSLGALFGRILQSTISRQREFLADASAVQFTRNPAGMASALKTIGALSNHSALESPRAGEISHMLFAAGGAQALFATHPPLDVRIRRFDPGFSGDYKETYAALERRRAALAAGVIDDDENDG